MTYTPEKNIPDMDVLRERALDLILSQNTMTLATSGYEGAWAAPVYYANIDFTFYFFSAPTSRHIGEAVGSEQVSAAVFQPGSTWKDIRGIQMSGKIHALSPGLEAIRALRAYLRKFPFTKDFFSQKQNMDLDAFAKTFRVRLYRFRPTLLYYMDNRIHFSFRKEIPLT